MSWARRLKRLVNIKFETGGACGGVARFIARIKGPLVIRETLAYPYPQDAPTGFPLGGNAMRRHAGGLVRPNGRRRHRDAEGAWVRSLLRSENQRYWAGPTLSGRLP